MACQLTPRRIRFRNSHFLRRRSNEFATPRALARPATSMQTVTVSTNLARDDQNLEEVTKMRDYDEKDSGTPNAPAETPSSAEPGKGQKQFKPKLIDLTDVAPRNLGFVAGIQMPENKR